MNFFWNTTFTFVSRTNRLKAYQILWYVNTFNLLVDQINLGNREKKIKTSHSLASDQTTALLQIKMAINQICALFGPFRKLFTYFKSGMDHYCRGRPFGGIGWIVSKKIDKLMVSEVKFHSRRISSIEIGNLTLIRVYLTSNDSTKESVIEHKIDLAELNEVTGELQRQEKLHLISGDFNSDLWRNKTHDKHFVDFLIEKDLNCLEKNFENKIAYTYTNGLHYSCIDHVVGSSHVEAMIEGAKIKKEKILFDWTNPLNQIEYTQLLEIEIIRHKLIENLNEEAEPEQPNEVQEK
ncbi:hypothetical protein BpHYR1_032062 [Brachionus plicatilis]|uniref:RNA-directed DNA polymerase from mobile element jockey-like n=1 Tax=Brachionus plicatilis TaxID=10195 RepID=A0A3M7R947_BRAPC|nr:hypothetical protein BpHYR1_032062 [Brachionus plicatilis]